jgi:glycosyltransferase involved in cell wall biosynthesis
VYNVEQYLYKCISSVFDQNLGEADFEVIAVNDGSTDNSLVYLEAMSADHPNLKIISQENQGLSGARNTGMRHAQGSYIIFVDSDDTLLPNVVQGLLEQAATHQLDMLEFGAAGITPNGELTYTAQASTHGQVYSGPEYISAIPFIGSACNKVYRSAFLKEHKLQFMPNVFIEDIEFNTRALFLSQRIMATGTICAYFLERQGSITRTKNYTKTTKMIYDIATVIKAINNFTEHTVTSSSVAYPALKSKVSSLAATLLLRVLKEPKDLTIKKDILALLKKEQLYPTVHKAETAEKNKFLRFANKEILYRITCFGMATLNKWKA